MYTRQPLNELDLVFCRKCGLAQQDPESTVCERCGADLERPDATRTPSARLAMQVRRTLRKPSQLISRGSAALLLFISIIIRTVVLLVALTSLVVGISLVPAVNARVPATKDVVVTAEQWLQRAEAWSATLMAYLQTVVHPPQRATQPSTGPQLTRQSGAREALEVDSTPSGATVKLGTRTIGKTPVTLRLTPGTYTLTISRPGYAPVTRTITVKQGRAASLGVTLHAADRAAPPSSVPNGPRSKQHKDKTPPGQDDDEP